MRQVLGGAGARRERDAELLARLPIPSVASPPSRAARPVWVPVFAGALVAALTAFAWVWHPWAQPVPEETLRGGLGGTAPLRVRVYAEREGGAAELLGELPGTLSATVPAGARVQISARGDGAVDATLAGRTLRVPPAGDFAIAADAWVVDAPGELQVVDAAGHRVSCRIEVRR
jgi:hypothetical protein